MKLTEEQKKRLAELSGKTDLTDEEKKELSDLQKLAGDTDNKNQEQPKGLSREEVQAMIDSREKEWQSKFDRLNTEKTQLEKEKEDLEKAKLTEKERAEYDIRKKEEELKKEREAVSRKILEIDTIEILKEKEVPFEFKKFLMGTDKESTTKNIELFKGVFDSKIQEHIDKIFKERGAEPDNENGASTGHKNPWVPGPNYNLTEQARLIKENPELAASMREKAKIKI